MASLQPDVPLPCGFCIQAGFAQAVPAGRTGKPGLQDGRFVLPAQLKSVPSGVLQDWPPGSLLTFDTLQALMVSRSDNTATNLIMEVLGRDFLEQHLLGGPLAINLNELFCLRQQLTDQDWKNADLMQKRALLKAAQRELSRHWDLNLGTGRISHEIGYPYSTRQLCQLISGLQDSPYLSILTGPAVLESSKWKKVAYKGGEEAGVFNLTALVETHTGITYTASATWNRKQPLHVGLFKALFKGIFVFLEQRHHPCPVLLN